jgi:glycosyltransferase involved in cell wall biosynthesis
MQGDPAIFVLQANENWVTDIIVSDFLNQTSLPVAKRADDADIIWMVASWCWNHIDPSVLKTKKVVCTVHHIVPEKLNVQDFLARDQFVDVYFVYTHQTANIIRTLSKKPIARIAHWVDDRVWPVTDRLEARSRLEIEQDDFVIGSFQRDTEGRDLTSPKLEKGPDILCDLLERMSKERQITVLLGGWRREYVLRRMSDAGVKVIYRQLPPQAVVKDMYASCDLYLCTSRLEGGPMCILEASIMKVPILSTDVGIARDVLHPSQIFNPSTWDYSLPSEEAISHSYARALERDPKKLILAYDAVFRQIFSPTSR